MALKKLEFKNDEEKEFWKNVAIAVAGSSNVTSMYKMYEWADKAVEFLRERDTQDKKVDLEQR